MYGVSKLLESTYSRLLAERLAPQGIDVNACCPGRTLQAEGARPPESCAHAAASCDRLSAAGCQLPNPVLLGVHLHVKLTR